MRVTINFKLVFYNVYVCVFVLSHVQLFATPATVAHPRLCPWNFPGKTTGVGCYFLTQGSNTWVCCISCISRQIPCHYAIWEVPVTVADL